MANHRMRWQPLLALGLVLGITGCSDTSNNGQPDTVRPEVRAAAGRTAEVAVREAARAAADARVAGAVRTRLADDPKVRAYRIDVQARQGVVTLTGEVNSQAERARAEEVAGRASGVRSVVNNLKLMSGR